LSAALDWLEQLALEPEPAEADFVGEYEESLLAEEPVLPDELVMEEAEADVLSAGIFDMPEDPDEALAWLEEMVEDEILPVETAVTTIVIEPEEMEEEVVPKPEAELLEEMSPEPFEQPESQAEYLFDAGIFDMPDDPDAALSWLEEVSEDDVPLPVAEPVTPIAEEPETVVFEQPAAAGEVDESGLVDVGLGEDFLSDVPEDPDEAMAWLEQLAARQGASLDELPTVSQLPDEIEMPDWIAAAAEQAETAVPAAPHEPEPEAEVEFADIADDDVYEEMPSWLEMEGDDAEGVPSQTNWLSDIPEPDVVGWLAAEAEASGSARESTGPLPETGPLFEKVVPDTTPFEVKAVPGPDEDLPVLSDTDELDSSAFRIDEDQLDEARSSLSIGQVVEALSTYRELVTRGEGLMLLINELETAAFKFPQQIELRRLLGDAYMRNGQLQKALTTYREALDQL